MRWLSWEDDVMCLLFCASAALQGHWTFPQRAVLQPGIKMGLIMFTLSSLHA